MSYAVVRKNEDGGTGAGSIDGLGRSHVELARGKRSNLNGVVGDPAVSGVRTTCPGVALQQNHVLKIVVWNGHGAPKQDVDGSAARDMRLGGTCLIFA
jgi:hypothetical protein